MVPYIIYDGLDEDESQLRIVNFLYSHGINLYSLSQIQNLFQSYRLYPSDQELNGRCKQKCSEEYVTCLNNCNEGTTECAIECSRTLGVCEQG